MPLLDSALRFLSKVPLPRRAPTPQQVDAAARDHLIKIGVASESMDLLDRWDMLRAQMWDNDGSLWRPLGIGQPPVVPGGRANRQWGRDRYSHWSEQNLLFQRDAARILATEDPIFQGILEHIVNFTVGKGVTAHWRPKKGKKVSESNLQLLNDRVKAFEDRLDEETGGALLWEEYHGEFVVRSVVDGEAPTRIHATQAGGTIRPVEPEQITQPPGASDHDGVHLGVFTEPGDVVRRLGYWVTYAPGEVRGEFVPARDMIFYKRNTPSNVVRGVSDAFSVTDDLQDTGRLVDKIRVGARVKASIAYIEKLGNVAPGAAATFAAGQATNTFINPLHRKTENVRRMPEGAILTASGNYDVTTLPQGNTLECIEAAQFALRVIVCSRWCFPEYMATADASNNNYASIFVAGGPSVRYFEKQQSRFGTRFKAILRRIMEIDEALGFLPVGLLDQVEMQLEFPTPIITDQLQEAQKLEIEHRNGITSGKTWQGLVGREPEEEAANFEEELERNPDAMTGMGPQGQGDEEFDADKELDSLDAALNGGE